MDNEIKKILLALSHCYNGNKYKLHFIDDKIYTYDYYQGFVNNVDEVNAEFYICKIHPQLYLRIVHDKSEILANEVYSIKYNQILFWSYKGFNEKKFFTIYEKINDLYATFNEISDAIYMYCSTINLTKSDFQQLFLSKMYLLQPQLALLDLKYNLINY